MTDVAKYFLEKSRSYLCSQYLLKIERCLEGLSEEDIWWRPDDRSNSIGNLILHLDGSTRTWILNVSGGAGASRDRQQEFDQREQMSCDELIAKLKQTLADADQVLAGLNVDALLEWRTSPWEDVTVMDAIYHAVEHFSMHTGQIIMLAKMKSREDIRLSE